MKEYKNILGKLICLLLIIGSTNTVTVIASDFRMETIKFEKEYSFAESLGIVGVDQETGEVIPLSEYVAGYFYAWIPEGKRIMIENREVDFDEGAYLPHGLLNLRRRGVVQGDESGNLFPEEWVSRAEFAVMLARIAQFPAEDVQLPYQDVMQTDWYYPSLRALYKNGILSPDEWFEPNRNVTREEAVTMLWRMVSALGGKKDAGNFQNLDWEKVQDFHLVQAYAKPAYQWFDRADYTLVKDVEEYAMMDTSDDEYYLRPQLALTREEIGDVLYLWMREFMRNNSPSIARDIAIEFGLDKEMPIIDGSTSTYPITQEIYGGLFLNAKNHPEFPAKHSKTTNAYKRLIRNEVDLILVSDAGNDVTELAEREGVELLKIPIAAEGFVFFTGKNNSIEGLRSTDIEKIYVDNSITNWSALGGPDVPFAAFCRNEESGSHAQMEKFFLNGREIHPDIQRERTSIMMSSILTDVEKYERENPGTFALGYSMYYFYHENRTILGVDNLKLLAIDGIAPTEESIEDGSYPLSINYYAVIRADEPEDSPARRLLQFITQ